MDRERDGKKAEGGQVTAVLKKETRSVEERRRRRGTISNRRSQIRFPLKRRATRQKGPGAGNSRPNLDWFWREETEIFGGTSIKDHRGGPST